MRTNEQKPLSIIATAQLMDLAADESENFIRSIEDLSNELPALDDLVRLYFELWDMIRKAITGQEHTFEAILNCFHMMIHDLYKGTLSICRGHTTDAQFYTRRAIETVASMIEIMKDLENAIVWRSLAEDKGHEAYVKTFMAYRLVKGNLSENVRLTYDQLCLSVHPSLSVVAGRGQLSDSTYQLEPFDVMSEADIPRQRTELLWLFSIHQNVLTELAKAFIGQSAFDKDLWQTACDKYRELWTIYFNRLTDSGALPHLTGNR